MDLTVNLRFCKAEVVEGEEFKTDLLKFQTKKTTETH